MKLTGLEAFFFDMIFDVSLYMFLINYLFPAITHVIYNYSVLEQDNVEPFELAVVYVLETFSWVVFFHTFYLMCKHNSRAMSYKLQNNKVLEKIAIIILIVYFLLRISTLGMQEDEPNEWEQRLFFILPFINLVGYMLAIFIVFAGRRYFSSFLWYVALVAMGAFFLGAILGGIRGAIVTPVVWAGYIVFKFRGKKERRKYVMMFITVLIGFTLIQPIFMGFRVMNSENISLEDKIEIAANITTDHSLQNTDNRYEAKNLLKEMDYRYGAQGTYTVGFYRLVDKEGYVGLNCIVNSFYTFMPSVLVGKDKPVSTSSDGTQYGMGMYKCVNAIDGSQNMCGFFSSGHAYWELGFFGIIIFSIIPAVFDFWCVSLFRRMDILGIPLYTAIFMKSFVEIKMWVSLIVVDFAQIILPLILLIFIYRKFYKSRRQKLKVLNR